MRHIFGTLRSKTGKVTSMLNRHLTDWDGIVALHGGIHLVEVVVGDIRSERQISGICLYYRLMFLYNR